MKLIATAFAALILAVLSLSVAAPIFTTEATADRMNGKATCGQMNCMQDRYYAAKRKEAQTKKPTK
jgi:Tfp pilus assembly protein PilE